MVWYCHEDGTEFHDLEELRTHLKAKTAWSNSSLVGCRVSVLLENREWSEGLVSQYHRSSGKHCIEFRHSGARRWLVMLRTTFYIVDRVALSTTGSEEMKEPERPHARASPEPWTFSEDLTPAFARAQSVLHECYGGRQQETGHKTLGHVCVTDEDKRTANDNHGSLLYGELLPRGVNKALDVRHLDASRATALFDLGMGTGKVAMQAFLQYSNLKRVYGVELSMARYKIAEQSVLKLSRVCEGVVVQQHVPGQSIAVKKVSSGQVLHVEYGNLMSVRELHKASIVMLETEIPTECFGEFSQLLAQAREGCRLLTYLDLRKVWQLPGVAFPFRQLEANRSFADRYPTSWSVHRGHHLFLWVKVLKTDAGLPHEPLSPAAPRAQTSRGSRDARDHEPEVSTPRPASAAHQQQRALCLPKPSSPAAKAAARGLSSSSSSSSSSSASQRALVSRKGANGAPTWGDQAAGRKPHASRSSKKASSSHATCVIA